MNIKQAWIQRYGRLQEDLSFDGNIHLIQGPNESGKTLLVEALLKFLIGDGAVSDARVDEKPEGFVVVSDGGDEHKLEPAETLVDYYEEEYNYEITPSELRNIFVIQDADLRIDGEDQFYERVTDRITGIRTQDIRRVKQELREEGRLTEKRLNISSAGEYNDAGTQIGDARDLKSDIEDYIDEKKDDVEELESQRLEAKLRKQDLEEEKTELEKAREKQEYENLVESKETIEENLTELEGLPDESVFTDLKQRLDRFGEGDREELTDQKDLYSTFTKWAIAGAVVTTALVLLTSAPLAALLVPGLGFVLAGYCAFQVRRASSSLATLDTDRESLINEAQRIGISVDDLGALRPEMEQMAKTRQKLTSEIDEEKGVLKNDLEIDANDPEVGVEQAGEALAAMEDEVDMGVDREFSQTELDSVEGDIGEVEDRIGELDDALREHQEALQEFSERAYKLDFRAFTGEPLELQVTNVGALEDLVNRLEGFITQIDVDAELSKTAYRVFDRMKEAEEEKVTELFGDDSRATELFCQITDDRYERIRYDHEENQLVVERSTEQQLSPEDLSKGTRDQLYLCIRLALAQKLPDLEGGFFIMDDAFLAADPDRLERQASLIDNLADQGWQVIYLTAKQDAVETLRPHADGDVIELDQLP
jgi:chromosome segregation ATPase